MSEKMSGENYITAKRITVDFNTVVGAPTPETLGLSHREYYKLLERDATGIDRGVAIADFKDELAQKQQELRLNDKEFGDLMAAESKWRDQVEAGEEHSEQSPVSIAEKKAAADSQQKGPQLAPAASLGHR